jgi:nitrite reductase (NADH) small subunit
MAIEWFKVIQADTIPVNEGKRVRYGNYDVALFNLGNGFAAIDNRCPHKSGPLADGLVSGDTVVCPLHGWKISVKTGCVLAQGVGQVRVYPTQVIDKNIYIAFNEWRFHSPMEAAPAPGGAGEGKEVSK